MERLKTTYAYDVHGRLLEERQNNKIQPDEKILYTVEAGGQTYIVEYHPNHGGTDHVKKESAYPPPGKTKPVEFRIPNYDPGTPCVSDRPGKAPGTFAPGDLLPTKIK